MYHGTVVVQCSSDVNLDEREGSRGERRERGGEGAEGVGRGGGSGKEAGAQVGWRLTSFTRPTTPATAERIIPP